MMKKSILIIAIALLLILAGCVNTSPNPIIGAYEFSKGDGSTGSVYDLNLASDGTFTFIQYGGSSSETAVIFTGTYTVKLGFYDFLKSSGVITFNTTTPSSTPAREGLVLTSGSTTEIEYSWVLNTTTGAATLTLDKLRTGAQISTDSFNKRLETEKSAGAIV